MAFFSGLKAAYDSIGSEISKTFDSSKDGQNESDASPQQAPESTPPSADKVLSVPLITLSDLQFISFCALRHPYT